MSKRVLIVEDAELWQRRHNEMFKQLFFDEIVIKDNYQAAIKTIDESPEPFDIITVDMNLDVTNEDDRLMGLEILQHILDRGRGERCFIVSAEAIGFSNIKEFVRFQQLGILVDNFDKAQSDLKQTLMRSINRALQETSRIFISYRRHDSASVTGRLYDRLVANFGQDRVFKDVEKIAPGDPFPKVLKEQLEKCQVLLVVIGKLWMADKRLENPNDWVRIEIVTALERGIRVIPVLVEGASLPASDELPEDLRPITENQTISLRQDPDFNKDIQTLIEGIEKASRGK